MVNRIKQVLEWQQLSPTQFADRIGVGRPVVSHILSERNKPSLDVLQHIRVAFPELSTDWLLDGLGPMLRAAAQEAAEPVPPVVVVAPVIPVSSPQLSTVRPPQAMPISQPASPAPATASAAVPPNPVTRLAIPRFQRPSAAGSTEKPAATVASPAAGPTTSEKTTQPVATTLASPSLPQTELLPASAPEPMPVPMMSAATLLAEPGKAIRRIVIFYRDGSFADFQPEA